MSEDRFNGGSAVEGELELDGDDQEAEETEDAEDGAELEDAEAGDGEDADGDGRQVAEEERPARPLSRNARRAERWRDRAREYEAENRRLEERLSALERGQQQRVDPQAAQRAHQMEMERIALLPPDQQIVALTEYNDRRYAGILQAQRAEMQDLLDRQDYQRFSDANPTARRLQSEVERVRRENPSVSRRVILSYLVGEEVMQKAAAATTRARRNGRAAVRRETTRPAAARSTEGRAADRNDDAAYRKRLATYTF